MISATVLYDSNSVVDLLQIQKRLQQNYSTSGIAIRDNADTEVYDSHFAEENEMTLSIIFLFFLSSESTTSGQ